MEINLVVLNLYKIDYIETNIMLNAGELILAPNLLTITYKLDSMQNGK